MKNRTLSALGILALTAIVIVPADTGCNKQDAHTALDGALSAAQLLCIFQSTITEAQELKTFCRITQDIDPSLLHNLIGQRVAARRVGVTWDGPTDAGAQ